VRAFIQRLIDNLPGAFYVKDAESRYVMVNEAFARERGRSSAEIVGRTSAEVPGAQAQTAMEHRVEDEHGAPLTMGYHAGIGTLAAESRDLQAAFERERELRKRTQTFVQRLLDVIPDPFYVKSAEGRFIIVNEAYAREKQAHADDLVGMDSYILEPEECADDVRMEDRVVLDGVPLDQEKHTVLPERGAASSPRPSAPRRAPTATARRCRCSSSTSITSSASTTSTATRRATTCCAAWPSARATACAARTCPRAGAARSSWCCCR
jgi:PAS domain-containing protein